MAKEKSFQIILTIEWPHGKEGSWIPTSHHVQKLTHRLKYRAKTPKAQVTKENLDKYAKSKLKTSLQQILPTRKWKYNP